MLTSMLAYSLLTLASAQAILLAVQDNHLRRHHPGGFIRALPPLQTMESLLFEMISLVSCCSAWPSVPVFCT